LKEKQVSAEDLSLLGCEAVLLDERLAMFQRTVDLQECLNVEAEGITIL
jgi:hypothetical protein